MIVETQHQYQPTESADANKAPPTSYPQTQMPTPHFVPTAAYTDQQGKTSSFGAPPTSYASMPSAPNAVAPRFSTAFPPVPMPTASTSSAFNPTSAPPLPPSAGQTSTFIGQQQHQQQQQQIPAAAPPQQGGFYGQQQAMTQQRPGVPNFYNTNNAFGQQQAPTPPSSSSPATINPSYIQPNSMPAPPPSASQQPYGGYQPQNNYYNPVQQ